MFDNKSWKTETKHEQIEEEVKEGKIDEVAS